MSECDNTPRNIMNKQTLQINCCVAFETNTMSIVVIYNLLSKRWKRVPADWATAVSVIKSDNQPVCSNTYSSFDYGVQRKFTQIRTQNNKFKLKPCIVSLKRPWRMGGLSTNTRCNVKPNRVSGNKLYMNDLSCVWLPPIT